MVTLLAVCQCRGWIYGGATRPTFPQLRQLRWTSVHRPNGHRPAAMGDGSVGRLPCSPRPTGARPRAAKRSAPIGNSPTASNAFYPEHSMIKMRVFILGLTFLTFCSVGCGPAENVYDYHSGRGQVQTLKIALDGGSIEFLPYGDTKFIATGEIAADGSFQLHTHLNRPSKEVAGVPMGDYQVSIRTAEMRRGAVKPISLPGLVTVRADDPTIIIKTKNPASK